MLNRTIMQVKYFVEIAGALSGDLNFDRLEERVNQWLSANPEIEVREIKHDVVTSIRSRSHIAISIYYDKK